MLTDEATIHIKAGKGGDGAVSFRREKYIAKGGPDGGDGGRGGNIYILCNPSVHTLSDYASQKNFKAEDGVNGMKVKKSGKDGEDLYLEVPPGTMIFKLVDDKKEKFADLTDAGEKVKIARSGNGGWGNWHFATATLQTPKFANTGQIGEEFDIVLELKILADVGLVGLPNVGKSTILSRISNARPKIADYRFTTLEPNLGMVKFHDKNLIFADIPGLIEGASMGRGLGVKFLKHVERAKVLVHIIDGTAEDYAGDYKSIREEFKSFNPELSQKDEIVAVNKADAIDPENLEKNLKKLKKASGQQPIVFSAVTGENLDKLLTKIFKLF